MILHPNASHFLVKFPSKSHVFSEPLLDHRFFLIFRDFMVKRVILAPPCHPLQPNLALKIVFFS